MQSVRVFIPSLFNLFHFNNEDVYNSYSFHCSGRFLPPMFLFLSKLRKSNRASVVAGSFKKKFLLEAVTKGLNMIFTFFYFYFFKYLIIQGYEFKI